MSVRPKGTIAAPPVADLVARSRGARAQLVASGSNDDPLSDLLVDELAEKVSNRLAERLADRVGGQIAEQIGAHRGDTGAVVSIPDGAKYATSEQLAARFQVSVQWVESHSANLGATPISDSANSKLGYHLATADAFMDARRRPAPTRVRVKRGGKPTPRKRTHSRTGRALLDVE